MIVILTLVARRASPDRVNIMEWEVFECILSPATGTVFAAVESAKKLKMILWYQGDFITEKGTMIIPTSFGIAVNGTLRNITLLRAFPWNNALWHSFQLRSDCPRNTLPEVTRCLRTGNCRFRRCPYGSDPVNTSDAPHN